MVVDYDKKARNILVRGMENINKNSTQREISTARSSTITNVFN